MVRKVDLKRESKLCECKGKKERKKRIVEPKRPMGKTRFSVEQTTNQIFSFPGDDEEVKGKGEGMEGEREGKRRGKGREVKGGEGKGGENRK